METLGTTQTNWKEQKIEFDFGKSKVKLKGEVALGKSIVTLRTMERDLKREKAELLIEFGNTQHLLSSATHNTDT